MRRSEENRAGRRWFRLEPLLTTPVERSSLLLGKMAATTSYMLLALALTLAAFGVAWAVIWMTDLLKQ